MFNPFRPKGAATTINVAVAIPGDVLPAAVLRIDAIPREEIGELIQNLSAATMDQFISRQSATQFQPVGQAYAAYDNPSETNAVAQFWKHASFPDDRSAVVIRRTGDAQFSVEADEGANFIVLYKGDAQRGKGPAALLCFTDPGEPTQYIPAGDSTVFTGANFNNAAGFFHIKDHVLRQCTSCTAHTPRHG